MYRRILLAYDGSLEGALALREGALLAKACCSEVVLLSVAPGTPGVQIAEAVQGGVIAQLMDSQRQLLDRACARLTQLGFSPIARLECGEPAQIIGAVAAEMGADLVVVGHHEQSMLSRWWSGSTDASLIDHVDCSVLVCRNPMSDEAFEAEARERGGLSAMLQMRPNCECCDRDLPATSGEARICSFECTFCAACASRFGGRCPTCGGELLVRPTRAEALLARFPASAERVLKDHPGCVRA